MGIVVIHLECERSSRMSSWGFMSFVLSIVNGVINISNNINNNNNNRNNNNNDNNNNQFNTNLDSSSNTQMAGGMAMTGRKIEQIERLQAIRDRFRRKLDSKYGGGRRSNITKSSASSVPTQTRISVDSISTSTTTENPLQKRVLQAKTMLEDLYQQEI